MITYTDVKGTLLGNFPLKPANESSTPEIEMVGSLPFCFCAPVCTQEEEPHLPKKKRNEKNSPTFQRLFCRFDNHPKMEIKKIKNKNNKKRNRGLSLTSPFCPLCVWDPLHWWVRPFFFDCDSFFFFFFFKFCTSTLKKRGKASNLLDYVNQFHYR